jgi:hypothetical protein
MKQKAVDEAPIKASFRLIRQCAAPVVAAARSMMAKRRKLP